MTAIFETAASLRFFGDTLDPDEITAALGAMPTVGVRKGGIWRTELGAEKISRQGSWRLRVQRRRPGDLDGQIAELFEPLTTDLAIWTQLAVRFRADIFCGIFMKVANEGVSLRPETLAAIGGRGLLLDFDIYVSEVNE